MLTLFSFYIGTANNLVDHLRLHNHNFGVGQGGPVAQNPDEDNGGDGGEEGSGGDEVEGDDEEDEDEEE